MKLSGPSPYFLLPGNARQALAFYQGVFGGEVAVSTYGEFERTDGPADAIAHGMLRGEIVLFAADAGADETAFGATGLLFSLLGATTPSVLHAWFDALSVGGTVLDPLQVRPWGDTDGQVRDPFGATWLIGYEAPATDDH